MAGPPPSFPSHVAFVGHRLGGDDGLSVASSHWQKVVRRLGAEVTTIAAGGEVDHIVPELACRPVAPGEPGRLEGLLEAADLVVVENCCSDRCNPAVSDRLACLLAGRPAVLRHHELSWQHPHAADSVPPPVDPAWRQVTVNERSRLELAARGIEAETFYHAFDVEAAPGDREATRAALGLGAGERLVLQPTRADVAKNVAGGLRLAAHLGAVYWLLGPVAEDYRDTYDRLTGRAPVRVVKGRPEGIRLADAYAACDAVVLPSTWESFGNATIESAVFKRPLAVGTFPVLSELRRYGFRWFRAEEPGPLRRYLANPDPAVTARNEQVARMRFSLEELAPRLVGLMTRR